MASYTVQRKVPETSSTFCPHCGQRITSVSGRFCPHCGNVLPTDAEQAVNITYNTTYVDRYSDSPKSRMAAALLCFFLGLLGVHRFYVGKVGTGLLWLFTGGLLGVGALIDFIIILCGSFTDKQGRTLSRW